MLQGPDLSETEGISQLGPGLNWEARECPLLMKKDFQELFPQYDIITMPLTVITVTQRTEYDNTLWSEEGDCERQRITENFVIMARKVVRQLTAAGYWADFIDPSSGRPYLSPRYLSVAALYETDERYASSTFTLHTGRTNSWANVSFTCLNYREWLNCDISASLMAGTFKPQQVLWYP